MDSSTAATDSIGSLNILVAIAIGICLVVGPVCFGPDYSGKYDRSRKNVNTLHTASRLALAAGLLLVVSGGLFPAGVPNSTGAQALTQELSTSAPADALPVNSTEAGQVVAEMDTAPSADDVIQIMLPINGESFRVSFKVTVSPLEVAIEFCDSVSTKYGLTPQNYHSNCVNPVQLFVTKEVKTHYRQKTKTMMARAAKQAADARKGLERLDSTVSTEVSGTQQKNAASSASPADAAPKTSPGNAAVEEKSAVDATKKNPGSIVGKKPTSNEPTPVKSEAKTTAAKQISTEPNNIGNILETESGSRVKERHDAVKAKAAARAAVESAKQRQAAKAVAKAHPSTGKSLEKQMEEVSKTSAEIAAPPATTENEKRLLREKEMADRIKYVDKRSQARLAALRAKAADREEREKKLANKD